jgi:hypothetical protein
VKSEDDIVEEGSEEYDSDNLDYDNEVEPRASTEANKV